MITCVARSYLLSAPVLLSDEKFRWRDAPECRPTESDALGSHCIRQKKIQEIQNKYKNIGAAMSLVFVFPYTGRVVPAASLSTRRIGSHKVTRCFHMFSLAVRLADVYSRVRPVEIPVDWERQPCLPLLFTLYVQYLCIHRERKRGSACCDTLHL